MVDVYVLPSKLLQLQRILSWNVNGLGMHRLDVHGTLHFISTFDVDLLTETRCEANAGLPMHMQYWLPVDMTGRAGVCGLVHPLHDGVSSMWHAHADVQSFWVRFQASMFGLNKDLFIASVYLPPHWIPSAAAWACANRCGFQCQSGRFDVLSQD